MSRCLIVALCVVMVAGCTSFATTLHHSDGRSVICGPYHAGTPYAVASAIRESQCIQDYQRQGFERAPQ